jgi:hypothetical protein
MAHCHATVESRSPAGGRHSGTWRLQQCVGMGPGVLAGEQPVRARSGPGSRFRLVVPFPGVRMPVTYEVIRFVPDWDVLLAAALGVLQSTDRIVVTGAADGSAVSYDAEVRLRARCGCSTRSCGRVSAPWRSGRLPGLTKPCPGARRVLGP